MAQQEIRPAVAAIGLALDTWEWPFRSIAYHYARAVVEGRVNPHERRADIVAADCRFDVEEGPLDFTPGQDDLEVALDGVWAIAGGAWENQDTGEKVGPDAFWAVGIYADDLDRAGITLRGLSEAFQGSQHRGPGSGDLVAACAAIVEADDRALEILSLPRTVSAAPTPGVSAKTATERALDAFWASVAESYPEATTGDLSPAHAAAFYQAAATAVRAWVLANVKGA